MKCIYCGNTDKEDFVAFYVLPHSRFPICKQCWSNDRKIELLVENPIEEESWASPQDSATPYPLHIRMSGLLMDRNGEIMEHPTSEEVKEYEQRREGFQHEIGQGKAEQTRFQYEMEQGEVEQTRTPWFKKLMAKIKS